MFLRSLQVQNFRSVREASLQFGPGLNVLFGPNELGKSTLNEAIRVGFLLPVESKAAEEFVPWGTDMIPRIVIEFETQTGTTPTDNVDQPAKPATVWRLTKTFGKGARGTALLEKATANGRFIQEAKDRSVEGRLRELLAWGIPVPGGKGAPRGIPESYLTTALLGEQDRVASIFQVSLDSDGTDSGRMLLSASLGALAQEPILGALLSRLQVRTREVFTETGKRSPKQSSPLVRCTEELNLQERRVKELEDRVRRSDEIEAAIQSLNEKQTEAEEQCRLFLRRIELSKTVLEWTKKLLAAKEQQRAFEAADACLRKAEAELVICETTHSTYVETRDSITEELEDVRRRVASLSAKRDQLQVNVKESSEARREALTARRNEAFRDAEMANQCIEAARTVVVHKAELTKSEQHLQNVRADAKRGRDLLALARLEHDYFQLTSLGKAQDVARQEFDAQKAKVAQIKIKFDELQTSLASAQRAVQADKDAFEQAKAKAREGQFRKETLQASRLRAQATVDRARSDLALVQSASESQNRLRDSESQLADLTSQRRATETILSNKTDELGILAAGIQKRKVFTLALLVGCAAMVALAVAFSDQRLVFGSLAALTGVAGGLTFFKLASSQRTLGGSVVERDNMKEQRSELATRCLMAQSNFDGARRDWDHASRQITTAFESLDAADKAPERLRIAQDDLKKIEDELRSLELLSEPSSGGTFPQVEGGIQTVRNLDDQLSTCSRELDEARLELFAAEARANAADEACLPTMGSNKDAIEQQIADARHRAGLREDTPGPTLAVAAEMDERAREMLADAENVVHLATERLKDREDRSAELSARFDRPPEQILVSAEQLRISVEADLKVLDANATPEFDATVHELQQAQECEKLLIEKQIQALATLETSSSAAAVARHARDDRRIQFERLRVRDSSLGVSETEKFLADARNDLKREFAIQEVADADVSGLDTQHSQWSTTLKALSKSLDETRGQLSLVGGAVARGQLEQECEILERMRISADELELEFNAAQHLLVLLREADAKYAAHLGRSLAKPVSEQFLKLTGNRYGDVLLAPNLSLQKVVSNNGERDLDALSVGTRHQLATLIRLSLAGYLRTTLILDDQLAHSDPHRQLWFRDRLRESVGTNAHQIIIVTCRPLDYLEHCELPSSPTATIEMDGLTVVNLGVVVSHH